MSEHTDGLDGIGLIAFIVILILAALALDSCHSTQTPYVAQKELKYWIKVGDTLVDKEWRTDTIIICAINTDSTRVKGQRRLDRVLNTADIMDYIPLYNQYVNLRNPHFKLSKPISYL